MRSRFLAVALAAVAMTTGHAAAASPQTKAGAWLDDAKPPSWNAPDAAIPAAPKIQGAVDPRCRAAARPPQLDEDRRVREQGWELIGAYQGGWEMLVIRGTAGYDGMCRPSQYQDFLFIRGAFAGTLSPQPMDSRADGSLQQVWLEGPARLTAEYARYDVTDPLCCPSRTTRVTFDSATSGVLAPVSAFTYRR